MASFETTPPLPTYLVAFVLLPESYGKIEGRDILTGISVAFYFDPNAFPDPRRLLDYALFATRYMGER